MATDAYNEDRLPWLDDTPSASTDARSVSGAVIYKRTYVLVVILIALLAGTIVVVTTLGIGPIGQTWRGHTQAEDVRVTTGPLPVREFENDYRGKTDRMAQIARQRGGEAIPVDQTRSPNKASPAVPAHVSTHVIELQLGAYRTESDALRGWRYLSDRFPLVRAYPDMVVGPLSVEDSLFRLRLLVPTKEEAKALCEQIRRGGQECFLVN